MTAALGLPSVAGALVLTLALSAHAQDFDPHGRRHPRPEPQGSHPHPSGESSPSSKGGAPTSGGGASGPAQTALIERYTRVVLSQAAGPFPRQRRRELSRGGDGNISRLVAAFEARAAQTGADQSSATVALAGLYKVDGRMSDAIAPYEKAISLKGDAPTAIV